MGVIIRMMPCGLASKCCGVAASAYMPPCCTVSGAVFRRYQKSSLRLASANTRLYLLTEREPFLRELRLWSMLSLLNVPRVGCLPCIVVGCCRTFHMLMSQPLGFE